MDQHHGDQLVYIWGPLKPTAERNSSHGGHCNRRVPSSASPYNPIRIRNSDLIQRNQVSYVSFHERWRRLSLRH